MTEAELQLLIGNITVTARRLSRRYEELAESGRRCAEELRALQKQLKELQQAAVLPYQPQFNQGRGHGQGIEDLHPARKGW